jgi:hypothetical protein
MVGDVVEAFDPNLEIVGRLGQFGHFVGLEGAVADRRGVDHHRPKPSQAAVPV